MRQGYKRHAITLQRRSTTQNATSGQYAETWTDLGNGIASITPVRGREYFAASGDKSEVTHDIGLRYQSGIALEPRDRVLFGTRTFDIQSVINVNERNREWQLMCIEKIHTHA